MQVMLLQMIMDKTIDTVLNNNFAVSFVASHATGDENEENVVEMGINHHRGHRRPQSDKGGYSVLAKSDRNLSLKVFGRLVDSMVFTVGVSGISPDAKDRLLIPYLNWRHGIVTSQKSFILDKVIDS